MDLRELQADYRNECRAVTVERITAGALIRTVLSVDDGLIFKNGRKEKPKRLVIIGYDKERQLCYGSVLVNTEMSPQSRYSEEYLATQYLLRQDNYPEFLDYNSYVDCGQLFAIPYQKLAKGEYFGELTDEDCKGVFDILETTETLTTKQKKRFGIKRR